MASCLAGHFPIRSLDVQATDGPGEALVGDVADLNDAMRLCEGCTELVIAHMAPNRPEIYGDPILPFDINVKGVANLFHAAHHHGLRRVVLISSTAVVAGHMQAGKFLSRDLPHAPTTTYGLTKALQENIAEYYNREKGMEVCVLRPAHICDEDKLTDKYQKKLTVANWVMIDPRDIAEAVRLSVLAPSLDYEVFYISGHIDAGDRADIQSTREFLKWQPRHTFVMYPREIAA
jgi:nucleoside-diphosphate-sugar epimerase